MSLRAYSEINLHITWHTKRSVPTLVPFVEDRTHRFLKNRILETPGVLFRAIGGTETHVHIGVSVPPTLVVSEWIGELKGASAYHVNHLKSYRKRLEWQSGYGVVSFGTRDLQWVVRYILNQKEHHAFGRVVDRLERVTTDEAPEKPAEAGFITEPS